MTREENLKEFKNICKLYLSTLGISDLRAYGRYLQLRDPTAKNKSDLIEDIIGVLCGEITPERTNKGAPIKNKHFNPTILEEIERLSAQYLEPKSTDDFEMPKLVDKDGNPLPEYYDRLQDFKKQQKGMNMLTFFDVEGEDTNIRLDAPVYGGQLDLSGDFACLLPLNGETERVKERVLIPDSLIERHDLRDGDVITCHAKKKEEVLVAVKILTLNDFAILGDEVKRKHFDDCDACDPQTQIGFYGGAKDSNPTLSKYVDWLLPIRKGQRSCVVSSPKSGKTSVLLDLAINASAYRDISLFVLLIDQPPEVVSRFRREIKPANLIYTTYEDDCEKQVFNAEFILKRAKRYVESGKDVLLIVDSLNALGRAYNETDESLGGRTLAGGLESKTVHYLKKYFGAARCVASGGSLTMIGAVSADTGNPADDIMAVELTGLSNHEIRLSEELARKRVYPSIDYFKSGISSELTNGFPDLDTEQRIKTKLIPQKGIQTLYQILEESDTLVDLFDNVKKYTD